MFKFPLNGILVSDGAIGTELLKRSNEKIPEILDLTNPEIVKQLHLDYINAGADIITTNSFGANRARFEKYKINDVDIYKLNKVSAQIANQVKPENKILFGSVGPTGLKPDQDEFKKIAHYFYEQISGLRDGNVDVILIETMTIIEEMKIAFQVARKETKLPIAVTMSFKFVKDTIQTYAGVDFEKAVKEMLRLDADIIGANCGNGFSEMLEIANKFRNLTKETPLIIQPSAGTPKQIGNKFIYPDTPEKIKEEVEKLLELNINVIGGCCGTTPEHIKVIREIVDRN